MNAFLARRASQSDLQRDKAKEEAANILATLWAVAIVAGLIAAFVA